MSKSEPARIEPSQKPRVAEFFAGIGLVRIGLEQAGFDVVWSNDIEQFKKDMYEGNFADDDRNTDHEFVLKDVANVQGRDIPDVDLAWASFPCTDVSLAGGRGGLAGKNSGTFYQFTRILGEMGERRPMIVALENVVGLATSHGGDDMIAAVRELNKLGYSVDVLAVDARRFVPQSRPRLFIVGTRMDVAEATSESVLRPDFVQSLYGVSGLKMHRAKVDHVPRLLTSGLSGQVEAMWDSDARWWSNDKVDDFVLTLSPIQAQRVTKLRNARSVSYRTAYRRTRSGSPVWEVRPDDISGCLRTARGGSSKQAVVMAGGGRLQVRWMTPLEYARLMGAGEYALEGLRDSQILFGFGDAVCAPAVAWLGSEYLMPLHLGKLRSTVYEDADVFSEIRKRA